MDRSKELEKLIKKYATSYYSGYAEVEDDYFDSLVEELNEINPDSEVLKTGWGYSPSKSKVSHWFDLHVEGISNKIKSVENIPDRFSSDTRVSAKLDGLSVVSYYVGGALAQSITRGNGYEGKDVTGHIREICHEARRLVNVDGTLFTGAIRGEVVMPNSIFESKYGHLKKDNPSLNPRNIASGLINREYTLEDDEYSSLKYVVYKVVCTDNCKSIKTLEDVENFFKHNLLCYVKSTHLTSFDEDSLKETFDNFRKEFPCDGLVLTDLVGTKGLSTSKYVIEVTYDEVAYKFQAESKEVTVTQVTYEATRTGRLAPRIWFDPVELSGALVRKCTGFNAKFIDENKIGPGAVIEVCRSGEVIPHIMRTISPSDSCTIPEYCPNCGTKLVWSGDDLVCESENESQLAYRFITTVAATDRAGYRLFNKIVEGFGLDSEEKFIEWLKYKESADIETMISDLKANTDISGEVTWNLVRQILSKVKSPVDPVTLLVACNIKGISWETSKSIIENYPKFYEDSSLLCFDENILYSINGVGWSVVSTLRKFRKRINAISSYMKISEPKKEEKVDTKFKVAITGSLSMKRSDFDAELNKRGIVQSSNFKEIKYLITNNPDSTSSKMKKAKENGVEIISEENFTKLYFN